MSSLSETVAENLRKERLRRRLSQGALAEKARISVSYVSMLERGRRSPPLGTLESIAKALNVTPTSLFR